MKPLRIAQIAPLWASVPPATYGGIELLVSLLTEELVRRGHDVTLFASGDSKTGAKLVPVCEENMIALMSKNIAGNYEYFSNAAVAETLRRADDFDLLHFHIGTAWIPFSVSVKTPALWTMHTFSCDDDVWAARHYPQAYIVGISRDQVRNLAAARSDEEIPIVYNGCDFSSYEPRFEPGSYLAFLGRMAHDKNPLDSIRIAKKLGMKILLAGNPQKRSEVEYFEKEIKPLIDGESVVHLGLVNHARKNEMLRNAAALLFPVLWPEPFGLVMIEAMACGTPVVAHDLGSVAEVIDDGVTGFRAGSISEMESLVPRALALDRRRVRERACERFGYERMVDSYLALYRRVLKSHG